MNVDLNNPTTKIFGKTVTEIDNEFHRSIDDDVEEFLKQNSDRTSSYKDLNFEEKAKYINNDTNEKQLFTYDKSDERIKQKKPKARHARPHEAFGLIINCLENKVNNKKLLNTKEDMLESYGEWLSCAFERQGNKLIVYLDPTGIKWNGTKHIKTKNFKFTEKKEFDIIGINSQEWTDLNKFSDEFVKYIYGRVFNELPAEMKEGNKRAQVYLPPDEKFWPVALGNYDVNYNVSAFIYVNRASRAVVASDAPKISTG